MVLLAAAICTKSGKALISRQFVEMTRSRIEGLLASFPKLIGSGKQHTFIETESVRYVYQPLEKLYMVLITTKASNILEDLETLRLFSRVIPEYCKAIEEKDIYEHSFDLLFAFDEIVALGYRENVNLPQIKTYTEMDSNEERIYNQMREAQEKDAKEKMLERAKEIQRARIESKKTQSKTGADYAGGFGSNSSYNRGISNNTYSTTTTSSSSSSFDQINRSDAIQPPSFSSNSGKPNRAMKLGGEKPLPSFVEQASKQIQIQTNATSTQQTNAPTKNFEKVHLKTEEKISVTCGRDGGLQNMELHGILLLRVANDDCGKIKVQIENNESRNVQLQTHPNVDKKVFTKDSIIQLKDLSKSFPSGQDVGVLKWRYQTQDETEMPLTINCWPSEVSGGYEVNIEYELQKTNLELNNVSIIIPIPSQSSAPVIKQIDGDYTYEKYKNHLVWRIGSIDETNTTGSLEFSVQAHSKEFFPINVNFNSNKSYCDIHAINVINDDNSTAKFSTEITLNVDKYEIV